MKKTKKIFNENSDNQNKNFIEDIFNIPIDDWVKLLKDKNIFTEEAIEMVFFTFSQKYQSTPTDIGLAMGVSQQKVSSINVNTARKIYQKYKCIPPNRNGSYMYWNVLFSDSNIKKTPSGYYVFKLRDNLIKAIQFIQDTDSDFFSLQNINKTGINNLSIYSEGEVKFNWIKTYGRNALARKKCIDFHGALCSICGFDFSKEYNGQFENLIVVHHIEPLGEVKKTHSIDPKVDLIPVCANCHLVIHTKKPAYQPEEIKKMKTINAKIIIKL